MWLAVFRLTVHPIWLLYDKLNTFYTISIDVTFSGPNIYCMHRELSAYLRRQLKAKNKINYKILQISVCWKKDILKKTIKVNSLQNYYQKMVGKEIITSGSHMEALSSGTFVGSSEQFNITLWNFLTTPDSSAREVEMITQAMAATPHTPKCALP